MSNGYIQLVHRILQLSAMDPVEGLIAVRSHFAERDEWRRPRYQQAPYTPTDDWECRVHNALGLPWPCPAATEFWELWPKILEPFVAKGTQIGRGAFNGWGDGEPALARAAWCFVRHLKPANVVETGVARGFTSRVVLEALERNRAGHLWSIDLPTLRPEWDAQVGEAVGDGPRHRWTYIKGSSRRRLPQLIKQIGQIGLFIHDSNHTEYNVRFELDRAWAHLTPGSVVMADDIDYNWGFYSFMRSHPSHQFFVCHGEPLKPDTIRFDGKGLIGIARKASNTH